MKKIYDISNDPITGLQRKVRIDRQETSFMHKWAALQVSVLYLVDGKELEPMRKKVQLVASNDDMVNPQTGQYVEKDAEGNYPDGSIGEYDWLESMIDSLNMTMLIDRAMTNAVAKKKFDN